MRWLHRYCNPAGRLVPHDDSRLELLIIYLILVCCGFDGRDDGGPQMNHCKSLTIIKLQCMSVKSVDKGGGFAVYFSVIANEFCRPNRNVA